MVANGYSARVVAGLLGISISSAIRWVQRARQTRQRGSKADRRGSALLILLPAHSEWLLSLIADRADLTLKEIQQRLHEERSVTSGSARCGGSVRLAKSVSKKCCMPPSSKIPTSPKRGRIGAASKSRLIPKAGFHNDTGTNTAMTWLRGRALRGNRVIGRVPRGDRHILRGPACRCNHRSVRH